MVAMSMTRDIRGIFLAIPSNHDDRQDRLRFIGALLHNYSHALFPFEGLLCYWMMGQLAVRCDRNRNRRLRIDSERFSASATVLTTEIITSKAYHAMTL